MDDGNAELDDPPLLSRWVPDAERRLGVITAGVLVLATPGVMTVCTWGHAQVGLAEPERVVAIAYGWLLTMGIGQVPVLLPVVGLAELVGRRGVSIGIALGAAGVFAVNLGIGLLFLFAGWMPEILSAITRTR